MSHVGQAYVNDLNKAVITQDIAAELVTLGYVYTIRKVYSLPAGLSEIFLDPTGVDPTEKFVVLLPPVFTAIGGEFITVSFYAGAAYSGGDDYEGINRDQTIDSPAATTLNIGGTADTPGVDTGIQWLIPTSSQGAAVATEGQATADLPFIINPTIVQRLNINNTDLAAQTLEIILTWAEIPRDRSNE